MTRQDYSNPVAEFLDQKGAVELVFDIGEGAKRFKELNASTSISGKTLTKRLKEGVNLGLWEGEEFVDGKGGDASGIEIDEVNPDWVGQRDSDRSGVNPKVQRYVITDRGREIMAQISKSGLARAIVKQREQQEEVEKLSESLIEWAEKNEI
ncbi:hypothetical protein [Haloarcula amylovorans]|uniref:hypothetical protein n=1 Tax=Haloarcula amylovorans TaxID=2562280 RepID=UPI001076AAB3|nr:hypothetical protein [Halomicroarcula amylolytica]